MDEIKNEPTIILVILVETNPDECQPHEIESFLKKATNWRGYSPKSLERLPQLHQVWGPKTHPNG